MHRHAIAIANRNKKIGEREKIMCAAFTHTHTHTQIVVVEDDDEECKGSSPPSLASSRNACMCKAIHHFFTWMVGYECARENIDHTA